MQRLMGLYGHEKTLPSGEKIMVGVGFLRNDCSEFHLVEEIERNIFGVAILSIVLICIICCTCYCCLKHRGKICRSKKSAENI